MDEDPGLIEIAVGDGRPLFVLTALILIGAGAFAIFQAATGQFLPQDTEYLGMTAQQLCRIDDCRILRFMIHDRISFGGVLVGLGVMYFWLAMVPLARGEAWAWWAFAASGTAGFLSFLAYLGYGYLDTWHGAATLVLLPIFVGALILTRGLRRTRVARAALDFRSRASAGRALLALSTFGITMAGATIMTVGMTRVFVPQDLEFMGVTRDEMRAINAHLVPLIAHDRAGFGGALVSVGLAMLIAVLWARWSRGLWHALAIAGAAGFGTAIGVHPAIGYLSASHVGPAILGFAIFAAGLAMTAAATSAAPTAPSVPTA